MIRLATADDAEAILEIYRPSIEGSAVSFETAVPSAEEMCERIISCLELYPWIVEQQGDSLRGYAYASSYHPRAAYRWAANVSVYVGQESLRRGIAKQLYSVLFAILQEQGLRKVLAAISVPNPASQQFHESLGFESVGVVAEVGFKLGRWQSMGWWQRPLGAGAASNPEELILFPKLAANWQGDLSRFADRFFS